MAIICIPHVSELRVTLSYLFVDLYNLITTNVKRIWLLTCRIRCGSAASRILWNLRHLVPESVDRETRHNIRRISLSRQMHCLLTYGYVLSIYWYQRGCLGVHTISVQYHAVPTHSLCIILLDSKITRSTLTWGKRILFVNSYKHECRTPYFFL